MRALTWQGTGSVTVDEVPEPAITAPTDVIIKVTSTAICGSDLHLLNVLGPFMHKGDVMGHEPMGVVVEVGSAVEKLVPGDRIVVPFVIACGYCYMCTRGLTTQCETTQNREHGTGADLYGYTELYGHIPGGQAEYLTVHNADFNAIKVTSGLPDERYLFLSDILPTAWQGVKYANVPDGGTLLVLGLGPVGQFASRIGRHLGYRTLAVDLVPERRAMAERHGVETLDLTDDLLEQILDRTDGRGPHSVVDAVGMEAHGNPVASFAQSAVGVLPSAAAKKLAQTVGVDRLAGLMMAIESVQRGGTVSLSGVYGGVADPMPLMTMFDKQLTLAMGQCNVQRWTADLWPLVEDPSDPLGVMDLVTHRVPLEQAPEMYELFGAKKDGCVKVVLQP
ncbi:threonine dehydrogenase-like Zn-dependent dehydrogenase [Microbacteriaceae bacterium SG_E_30_P1]|uniref:Threonine dehydrogenase-like Zn-dependent dehydrogenase n=1 Tax=Antiquaquibacter oligotrophicus TaxID=2880260 RepID=A0ABT6KQ73_9MICO|nr:alcohol dehydrogenase catalytic domain-containing protein [Antiquaquibacter oligotrophicus]MDH6182130.1 threonine dehydrogenase-like Zn-dependent dehydrogenase [Antiquaquibacter oligotrophicus]UDF12207.1 alcohol dehydrogenase catalytic domain-containing protein [Antiquaquibacter oligotrophicus]